MHNAWEEMIPFYIAGTLPRADALRLEQHLAQCAQCRQALDEWQRIAAAVRADAASQMRGLPPLSPRVIAVANGQAIGRYGAASQMRHPSRAATTSLTLMAAVFTVVLLGGLLAFMVLNGALRREAEQVVLAPSMTPSAVNPTLLSGTQQPQIIIIEPSETPLRPLSTPVIIVPPTSALVTRVALAPLLATRAPLLVLPPTLPPTQAVAQPTQAPLGQGGDGDSASFSLLQSATCTAHVALSTGIASLYTSTSTTSPIMATVAQTDDLVVLARSSNGWLQVQYSAHSTLLTGWVQQELVYAAGNCDTLPLIDSTTSVSPSPSASPTVLPFPTPSPISDTVTSGQWTESRTVMTNACATSDADSLVQIPVSLSTSGSANGSTVSAVYGGAGTAIMLMRTSDHVYSGSTSTSQGILTLTLTFSTSTGYSGEEVITYSDGCTARASLSGVYVR